MSDETERPEDTVRRLIEKIRELEDWKIRYAEAAKIWDDLELRPNDQVIDAVLFAKITNFEGEGTGIGIGCSSGLDWIGQLGLCRAGEVMITKDLTGTVADDED